VKQFRYKKYLDTQSHPEGGQCLSARLRVVNQSHQV